MLVVAVEQGEGVLWFFFSLGLMFAVSRVNPDKVTERLARHRKVQTDEGVVENSGDTGDYVGNGDRVSDSHRSDSTQSDS